MDRVAWHHEAASRLPRILVSAALVAVVLFIGARTATASSATAGKQSIGNVTCDGSGSLSFSPPLTPAGTPGGQEKVTLTERLTGCEGSHGTKVPSSPQSLTTKPITCLQRSVRARRSSGTARCSGPSSRSAAIEQTIEWGKPFKEQRFGLTASLLEEEGIYYFFQHASGKHTLNVGLGLASASSRALQDCIKGMSGRLGEVDVRPEHQLHDRRSHRPHHRQRGRHQCRDRRRSLLGC